MRYATRLARTTLLAALAGGLAACGGRHHLAEYDFAGHSLAVVPAGQTVPRLWTGDIDLEGQDPVERVIQAGGRVVREMEARGARARLDSAAVRIDVRQHLADRTLERAALFLGARPGDRADADYLLEVDLDAFGLDARPEHPRVYVRGEAVLLDAASGREIWSARVHGDDPLTGGLNAGVVGDVITASALRSMSVADFERLLGRLADYAADRIVHELREDLRDVRR